MATTATVEYASHAPERIPNAKYPRLSTHHLLPDGKPDYLKLILTSKVYEILKETPLVYCPSLSTRLGNQIWLKREDLQVVRSYKVRGAYNVVAQLSGEERARGVVCASAGNHGQGLAYACAALGVQGRIFLPRNTPRQKRERITTIGGDHVQVVVTGATNGLGMAPARALAQADVRVVLAVRDIELGARRARSGRGRAPLRRARRAGQPRRFGPGHGGGAPAGRSLHG